MKGAANVDAFRKVIENMRQKLDEMKHRTYAAHEEVE